MNLIHRLSTGAELLSSSFKESLGLAVYPEILSDIKDGCVEFLWMCCFELDPRVFLSRIASYLPCALALHDSSSRGQWRN